eukprot:TRINITY_DN4861_c1_g2_i2.p1 TRINITY_DN4861_c1_g2~~TRINITY_DN4861_c1_g2_i2.p1  ORF type:complete len:371 (+),score=80.47 TRINITY_DN4861_c1_g2_i2:98-1210(+)
MEHIEKSEHIVNSEQEEEKCATIRDSEEDEQNKQEDEVLNLKRKHSIEQSSPRERNELSSGEEEEPKRAKSNGQNGNKGCTLSFVSLGKYISENSDNENEGESNTNSQPISEVHTAITPKYTVGEDYPWKEDPSYHMFKMQWKESPIPTHSVTGQKSYVYRLGSRVEKRKGNSNLSTYIPIEVQIELDGNYFEALKNEKFQISGSFLVENHTSQYQFFVQIPRSHRFHFNMNVEVSRKVQISPTDIRETVIKVKGTDFIKDPNNFNTYLLKVLFFVDCDCTKYYWKDYAPSLYKIVNSRIGVNFQRVNKPEKITLWSPEVYWFLSGNKSDFAKKFSHLKFIQFTQQYNPITLELEDTNATTTIDTETTTP